MSEGRAGWTFSIRKSPSAHSPPGGLGSPCSWGSRLKVLHSLYSWRMHVSAPVAQPQGLGGGSWRREGGVFPTWGLKPKLMLPLLSHPSLPPSPPVMIRIAVTHY